MLTKFPWKEFIINRLFYFNKDIHISDDELISIDDWDYFVKMQGIYSDYFKNHKE